MEKFINFFRKKSKNIYKEKYPEYYSNSFYNLKIINNIIFHKKTHIVSLFLEHLINNEEQEFLQKFYDLKSIYQTLPNILYYYNSFLITYPNYCLLEQRKYLYKNILQKESFLNRLMCNKFKKKENRNINIFNSIILKSINSISSLTYNSLNSQSKTDKSIEKFLKDNLCKEINKRSIHNQNFNVNKSNTSFVQIPKIKTNLNQKFWERNSQKNLFKIKLISLNKGNNIFNNSSNSSRNRVNLDFKKTNNNLKPLFNKLNLIKNKDSKYPIMNLHNKSFFQRIDKTESFYIKNNIFKYKNLKRNYSNSKIISDKIEMDNKEFFLESSHNRLINTLNKKNCLIKYIQKKNDKNNNLISIIKLKHKSLHKNINCMNLNLKNKSLSPYYQIKKLNLLEEKI